MDGSAIGSSAKTLDARIAAAWRVIEDRDETLLQRRCQIPPIPTKIMDGIGCALGNEYVERFRPSSARTPFVPLTEFPDSIVGVLDTRPKTSTRCHPPADAPQARPTQQEHLYPPTQQQQQQQPEQVSPGAVAYVLVSPQPDACPAPLVTSAYSPDVPVPVMFPVVSGVSVPAAASVIGRHPPWLLAALVVGAIFVFVLVAFRFASSKNKKPKGVPKAPKHKKNPEGARESNRPYHTAPFPSPLPPLPVGTVPSDQPTPATLQQPPALLQAPTQSNIKTSLQETQTQSQQEQLLPLPLPVPQFDSTTVTPFVTSPGQALLAEMTPCVSTTAPTKTPPDTPSPPPFAFTNTLDDESRKSAVKDFVMTRLPVPVSLEASPHETLLIPPKTPITLKTPVLVKPTPAVLHKTPVISDNPPLGWNPRSVHFHSAFDAESMLSPSVKQVRKAVPTVGLVVPSTKDVFRWTPSLQGAKTPLFA